MKGLIYLSVLIFSTIGSFIPVLFHQGLFSLASILGGTVGAFFGIWAAVKLNNYI